MAIQIEITNATVDESQLHVTVNTTNDAYPGRTERFAGAFDVSATPDEIQTQINAAVSLLWIALGSPTWTVPE